MTDQLFGWIPDGGHKVIAATMPALAELAPQLYGAPETEPVLLYNAWTKVLGNFPDYPAQAITDCESFGHGHANDLLQCIEISLGEPSLYAETDTEFLYGAGREVAGILAGRGGCYGAAMVKAMTQVGMVSRSMLGNNAAYSGFRAQQWGSLGPPAALKKLAAPFRLGSAALVKTWNDLVAAMSSGYPVTISSEQGFDSPRDGQGFCEPRGNWPHCMLLAGLRFDRAGACVCQSWGPAKPVGPRDLGQPFFSFWADRQAVEYILSRGDSWALCKAPSFAPRPQVRFADWAIAA